MALVIVGVVAYFVFRELWHRWESRPVRAHPWLGQNRVDFGTARWDAEAGEWRPGMMCLAEDRVEVAEGGRVIWASSPGEATMTALDEPPDMVRLRDDEGCQLDLIVDRVSPVEIVVGAIGRDRQRSAASAAVEFVQWAAGRSVQVVVADGLGGAVDTEDGPEAPDTAPDHAADAARLSSDDDLDVAG